MDIIEKKMNFLFIFESSISLTLSPSLLTVEVKVDKVWIADKEIGISE